MEDEVSRGVAGIYNKANTGLHLKKRIQKQ